ncbi:MAG TPA: rod-binding protein [Phycisphaerae bacterium]|nr:rod-binding protein [Phycisphaerae bacterium]
MSNTDLPLTGLSPADLLGPLGVGPANGLRRPGSRQSDKALRQAAKDFESVLLHRVLQEMKNTIPESGLTGSGATKQLNGLFWSFLARDIANQGGVGLWKDLYAQWSAAGMGQKDPAASVESSR